MSKPFSQPSENNKRPILEVLTRYLADVPDVLEIGSGTGQHAVFFGEQLPHLRWQTSDRLEHHEGIRDWIREAGRENVLPPLLLDVTDEVWPVEAASAVFSANTVHIMAWSVVEGLIRGVGRTLRPEGLFLLYGPFNYGGSYTSESNARFDDWLKSRDARSAIRHFEDMDREADKAGLTLVEDVGMPANNRLLVWRREANRVDT